MSPALLSGIAAVLYLAAAGDEVRQFLQRAPNRRRWFVGLTGLGLSMHWLAASLAMGLFNPVWSFSLGTVISLTASMVALSVLYLRWRQPVNLALMPLLTLIALVTAVAMLSPSQGRQVTSSMGIGMHVVLSLGAFAILLIAGVQAILLGWQNRALKTHQVRLLGLLPPIIRMERMLFDLITLGFITLTLALASGWWFVDDLFAQHLAHKTLLSLIAWGIFAGLLTGRRLYGWRGFTAAAWALSGIAVLTIGTLGTKIILEVILERI